MERAHEADEGRQTAVARARPGPEPGGSFARSARSRAGSIAPARFDTGARGRWAGDLQRTIGNGALAALLAAGPGRRPAVQRDDDPIPPNPYTIETPGGGATTELPANPYSGEADAVTLANPRFTGQPRLARIAAGQAVLSAADNGPAMRAVQQAFTALGFEMVFHGEDGQFGTETRRAIEQFRDRRGIPGTDLNARALGELDATTPAPGVREEHFYDYERLFADGYLDVTIAVGFDEGGSHTDQLDQAHAWLAERGFAAATADPGRPEQHRLRRDITYPTRAGNRITREVIVRVNLIAPGPGAAAQYGDALADSEIAIYNGHARRGIGPDFDADSSPAENFIIGVGSALHAAGRAVEPSRVEQSHYVTDRVNDLEQMTRSGRFDPERYRVWFFNACTTLAYFDELRGGILPDGMGGNLDLMGTQHAMPLSAEMPATLAMVDGIIGAQTIEQVTASMVRAGTAVVDAIPPDQISARDLAEMRRTMPDMVIHEGAGNNPVAVSP